MMTNEQLDYIQECIEGLLESNKEQRRGTTSELMMQYFDGKIDAFEVTLRTLKNSRSIFNYEPFKAD